MMLSRIGTARHLRLWIQPVGAVPALATPTGACAHAHQAGRRVARSRIQSSARLSSSLHDRSSSGRRRLRLQLFRAGAGGFGAVLSSAGLSARRAISVRESAQPGALPHL
jgi:hypothetical protein